MSESESSSNVARRVLGLGWLALLPLFVGALYLSAKGGIRMADQQVPPGSLAAPGQVEAGSRWRLAKAGLAVSEDIEALRDHAFARTGTGGAATGGVEVLGEESIGWELNLLPGGDRRYSKAKYLSGDRQGDEMWLIAGDLASLAVRADDEDPVQR